MSDTQTNLAWETLLDLSTTRPGPLHHRLAESIRTAIRGGRLPLGSALPPSRVLATGLGVSRWTVTEAYAQLVSEGFLAGKTGSATRVSWSPQADERRAGGHSHPGLPQLLGAPKHGHRPVRYDFSQCTPDYRAFPRRKWVEAIRVAAETAPFDRLGYSEPGGESRLREVLAAHLNRRRGTRVDPGLMTVFTGARQGVAALARALYADGQRVIGVEDPGSSGLWEPAVAAGLELVPLPVDERGVVTEALAGHPDVRAVIIGPARHVVTGAELAPERRSWLLDWAARVDGLVIEDDYDSEFSYDRQALPAMQGTDPHRVALIGSMSRTMTPTVNVGWVVAPRRWLDSVRSEPRMAATAPALNQLALAHFIESGAYDRHLRSSRQRFRARRDALVTALTPALPGAAIGGRQGGLHLLLDLPPGASARRIIQAAERRGVELCDLNLLRLAGPADDRQLMLGYGNLADAQVAEAVRVLVELIRESEAGL
ncbi:PLP-dependent aminotransferase family protein [Catenulispora pinisilvae]|uniref:MocR-like pyridoxine biosynthesis transcription factor PdxR n=1 Tax=Catenulispora pinisilvae TaxID=2705253 RepID=UPI0018928072|nr:PLP-dependent aminotransferase family protein [Catenulispora pinisilvae]